MTSANVNVSFDYEHAGTTGQACSGEEFTISVLQGPTISNAQQDEPSTDTSCSQGAASIQVENYRPVPVHVQVTDNSLQGISSVTLYYVYDQNKSAVAPGTGYASMPMTYNASSERWETNVPTSSDTRVWFYFRAEDNLNQTMREPESGAFTYDHVPDSWPPVCPTGLATTLMGKKQVDLSWNTNAEDDLRGYNVYRSSDCGNYSRVYTLVSDEDPGTPGIQYTDYAPTNNTDKYCYTYYITAEDMQGNESTGCSIYTSSSGDCPCP